MYTRKRLSFSLFAIQSRKRVHYAVNDVVGNICQTLPTTRKRTMRAAAAAANTVTSLGTAARPVAAHTTLSR